MPVEGRPPFASGRHSTRHASGHLKVSKVRILSRIPTQAGPSVLPTAEELSAVGAVPSQASALAEFALHQLQVWRSRP